MNGSHALRINIKNNLNKINERDGKKKQNISTKLSIMQYTNDFSVRSGDFVFESLKTGIVSACVVFSSERCVNVSVRRRNRFKTVVLQRLITH